MPIQTIYDIEIETSTGEHITLDAYRGQHLLIVNVASRCGFTPQYAALETLFRDYQAHGVNVLAFPCDQFRHQEPGTNAEIQSFAKQCFRTTFPIFAKIEVKGAHPCPLYDYLATHIQKKPWFFIPWNFTKILVDADGRVLRQFLPTTSFKTIRRTLDELLTKPSL